MLLLWIGLASILSATLADWIRGRRYGIAWYDWSFIRNRRALLIGCVVALLVVSTSLGSRWPDILMSVPPALVVGAAVALGINRHQHRGMYGPADRR
jgi:hypothetical protein